jgi:hypothetical protein
MMGQAEKVQNSAENSVKLWTRKKEVVRKDHRDYLFAGHKAFPSLVPSLSIFFSV